MYISKQDPHRVEFEGSENTRNLNTADNEISVEKITRKSIQKVFVERAALTKPISLP
jgi:hypothetical protein